MNTVIAVSPRTVNRGANPFAAIVKQANAAVTPQVNNTIYESVQIRGDRRSEEHTSELQSH